MKKEVSWALMIVLLATAVIVFYYTGGGPTGFAIFEQYTNETACQDAGYVWEELTNETCSGIVDCEIGVTGCVDTCEECVDEVTGQECSDLNYTIQTECETAGETWEDIIEQNCTTILDCEIGVTGCVDTCEECVEEIIGGQCTGDVCGADFLDLCLDETECTNVTGYWYGDVCNANEEPSCSNDLNLCDETNCVDTGGGYWYDDDCNAQEETEETTEETTEEIIEEIIPETISLIAALSADNIQDVKLNPEGSQEIPMVVTNIGTKNLISCAVKPVGEFGSWILVPEKTTNIDIDAQHKFFFDVVVPEETEEGPYSLSVSIECSETTVPKSFTVNVVEKKLEFNLISADRTRDDRVRVLYSLEELSGNDQEVVFTFSLVDVNNVEVGRVEVNQSIDANSSDEFKTNININESLLPINETTNETLESELTLNVNFNSQIYSSSIQEKVLIGVPIGGFAIFEGVGAGEAIVFVIVLGALVFIFVFARRMRKEGKTLKDLFKGKNSGST